MSNKLLFSSSAREKMTIGAKTLANAVKVTLGPKGRNVVIEQDFGSPLIVNDGVTIAKSITLEDKYENLGASILIEAATKTNEFSWRWYNYCYFANRNPHRRRNEKITRGC